jgi:hypothetical protein
MLSEIPRLRSHSLAIVDLDRSICSRERARRNVDVAVTKQSRCYIEMSTRDGAFQACPGPWPEYRQVTRACYAIGATISWHFDANGRLFLRSADLPIAWLPGTRVVVHDDTSEKCSRKQPPRISPGWVDLYLGEPVRAELLMRPTTRLVAFASMEPKDPKVSSAACR